MHNGTTKSRIALISLLQANETHLRQRRVTSLTLIGVPANSNHIPAQPLHLLVGRLPPHPYAELVELKTYLQDLLNHPVEVILVDIHQPEIAQYLSPERIEIF